jgi:hypothetical protein
MAKSDNLRKAKEAKNDEFYTRLEDIEAEISQHKDYVKQFEGKTVLCNCDDPEWSNFFLFFKLHFKQLKLNKLITTHFNKDGSPSYKLEWEGEMLNDDMVNLTKTPLSGNGDFRSDECVAILKEADIVVTNPPFSLFREYVQQLIEYDKKFIVIGNKNAIAYKEVFPLLRDGKMFVGYNAGNGTMYFATSHTSKGIGEVTNSVPSYWYTNLDLDKVHEPLILTKNYQGNEGKYVNYENYPIAINVNKISDIPKDYFGIIGVPITYMAEHCIEQFEIIGLGNGYLGQSIGITGIPKEHKTLMKGHSAAGDLYMMVDGKPKVPYNRILIRRSVKNESSTSDSY